MNPTVRTIDGHEQIAALALVGHLRQIFDVDVQVARLVVLETLWLGFGLGFWQQVTETVNAMATQATT